MIQRFADAMQLARLHPSHGWLALLQLSVLRPALSAAIILFFQVPIATLFDGMEDQKVKQRRRVSQTLPEIK
jgi:hypothetical protein